MTFKFDIYKDSEGYFISSSEYSGLFGWSPNLKKLEKHATDIASLFDNDFTKGKNETFGMPFIKSIEITIKQKAK